MNHATRRLPLDDSWIPMPAGTRGYALSQGETFLFVRIENACDPERVVRVAPSASRPRAQHGADSIAICKGIYMVRLRAGEFVATRPLIVTH
jgi:hypothetical protein